MKKHLYNFMVVGIAVALMGFFVGFSFAGELKYDADARNPVSIPPSERGLQTIYAEPWLKISDKSLQLEGPAYDRKGNLYIVAVFCGKVFKITPDEKISVIFGPDKRAPAALDIHKNGRLFLCGLGNFKVGSVYSINPDGSGLKDILSVSAGYLPDDLIFDSKGGFYFTDFNGYSTNPKGAVFYVSPDFKTVTKVLPNLSIGNGICLAPGGKTLWVTELGAGRLHRVNLADEITIVPFGATISYRFTGSAGPDSMCVDIDGNMYVAMYTQGRILVFNKDGFPIGQILIPGREKGEQLYTTSMCFKPGTNDMVLTTNDGEWTGKDGEDLGAWLYKCKGFVKELPLYSHQ
jgi:lactonase